MKEEYFIFQIKIWFNRIVKFCLNSFYVFFYLLEMKLLKNCGNVIKMKGFNNLFMKLFYSYGENIMVFYFFLVKNLYMGI